jgi:endonuclease/exonuclease/phosphatase family metal-dependent hydrolase
MRCHGLIRAKSPHGPSRNATFPSRLPFFSMDRIYIRGLHCLSMQVPKGPSWARMSDHLPLVAELGLA